MGEYKLKANPYRVAKAFADAYGDQEGVKITVKLIRSKNEQTKKQNRLCGRKDKSTCLN